MHKLNRRLMVSSVTSFPRKSIDNNKAIGSHPFKNAFIIVLTMRYYFTVFVKHYKDVSLALRLYLKDDTFEFRSWFEVRDKKVRTGLLLKVKGWVKQKKEEES